MRPRDLARADGLPFAALIGAANPAAARDDAIHGVRSPNERIRFSLTAEDRIVAAATKLSVRMNAGGGFAIALAPGR